MNFDDNAIFRRPDILKLRDLNEEEPAEIEASKYDLLISSLMVQLDAWSMARA